MDCQLLPAAIILVTFGVISLFFRDVLWQINAESLRSKGIKAIERTDDWEDTVSFFGVMALVLGLSILAIALC